ncbi:MAG TPA: aspartate carbamoyltransferase catalytic subunit [Acidobacteriota bacterium]|nr:aspartate carbamoyltransferase catalytic subunit [Acidobacteriota bacterium]
MDQTTTAVADEAPAISEPPTQDVAFPRNLVGIQSLDAEQIELVLDTAEHFRAISERPIKKVPALRGKTVVNLFFEPSTRTRTSFEIAGKRLSADVQTVSASTSSVVKGETLLDTARNIEAMFPDILVMRHASAGASDFLAKHCSAAVVNAGDGAHEHPTQALLDALTIRRSKGTVAGLRVVIVGDIGHSRVARSNILCLRELGAEVAVAAPPTLMPNQVESLGVTAYDRIEPALEGADVVMMLRIQVERGSKLNVPSAAEYFKLFGLTENRLAMASKDAIVMHPGPMNRGVEIASNVADGPRSVILEQVTNGLAVRMAILYLLAGGNPKNVESAA